MAQNKKKPAAKAKQTNYRPYIKGFWILFLIIQDTIEGVEIELLAI